MTSVWGWLGCPWDSLGHVYRTNSTNLELDSQSVVSCHCERTMNILLWGKMKLTIHSSDKTLWSLESSGWDLRLLWNWFNVHNDDSSNDSCVPQLIPSCHHRKLFPKHCVTNVSFTWLAFVFPSLSYKNITQQFEQKCKTNQDLKEVLEIKFHNIPARLNSWCISLNIPFEDGSTTYSWLQLFSLFTG